MQPGKKRILKKKNSQNSFHFPARLPNFFGASQSPPLLVSAPFSFPSTTPIPFPRKEPATKTPGDPAPKTHRERAGNSNSSPPLRSPPFPSHGPPNHRHRPRGANLLEPSGNTRSRGGNVGKAAGGGAPRRAAAPRPRRIRQQAGARESTRLSPIRDARAPAVRCDWRFSLLLLCARLQRREWGRAPGARVLCLC